MRTVRARRTVDAALLPPVLALIVLLSAGPFLARSPATASPGPTEAVGPRPAVDPPVRLSLAAPTALDTGGPSGLLQARWSNPAPGCRLGPAWYDWSGESATGGGLVAAGTGNASVVEPLALHTGPLTLAVRGATEITCPGGNGTQVSVAAANVTVAPALELSPILTWPDASGAPDDVTLEGTVRGGIPPYQLSIAWGDGGYSNETVATSGAFAGFHRFGVGTFLPRVSIGDATGATGLGVDPERITVGPGTELAIEASVPLGEVGQPVEFHGVVVHPSPYRDTALECGIVNRIPPHLVQLNVSCTPTVAGAMPVTLYQNEVLIQDATSKIFSEPIAGRLGVAAFVPLGTPDAGAPTSIEVIVVGGAPPFRVTVESSDGQSEAIEGVNEDGPFLVPWRFSEPGPAAVRALAADVLGVTSVGRWWGASIASGIRLSGSPTVTSGPSPLGVHLSLSIDGGTAPYDWVANVTGPASDSGPEVGSTTGSINWSGQFGTEVPAAIELWVWDSAGAEVNESVPLPIPGPPSISLSFDAPTNGSVDPTLGWSIRGGVAPFQLWVNATGSAPFENRTVDRTGALTLAAPGPATGTASVALVDAWEGRASAEVDLPNAPSPPPAPRVSGPGPPEWPPIALAVVGILAAGLLLRRWRRAPAETGPPAPDATEVLRAILTPADGADRVTVELLAEEEGVPLEEVRSTLDRLIRDGVVNAETDPDGTQVLAWADTFGETRAP